jgi:hypothetical protein
LIVNRTPTIILSRGCKKDRFLRYR